MKVEPQQGNSRIMTVKGVVIVSILIALSTCQIIPQHMKMPRQSELQKSHRDNYEANTSIITVNEKNVQSQKEVSKKNTVAEPASHSVVMEAIPKSVKKEESQHKIQNLTSKSRSDNDRREIIGWNDGNSKRNYELSHPKSWDKKVRYSNRRTKHIVMRKKREALEENTDMKQNFSSQSSLDSPKFTPAPENEHSTQYTARSSKQSSINDMNDPKLVDFSQEIENNDSAITEEIHDEDVNDISSPVPKYSKTKKFADIIGLHVADNDHPITSGGSMCKNGCECGCNSNKKDGNCSCNRHNESFEANLYFPDKSFEDTSRESMSSNEDESRLFNDGENIFQYNMHNFKKPYMSINNPRNSVSSSQQEEFSNEIFSSQRQKYDKDYDYELYSEEYIDNQNLDNKDAFSGLEILDQIQRQEFDREYEEPRYKPIGYYGNTELWNERPHFRNTIYERNLRESKNKKQQSEDTAHKGTGLQQDDATNIRTNSHKGESLKYANFKIYDSGSLVSSEEIEPYSTSGSTYMRNEKLISPWKTHSSQKAKITSYEGDESNSTGGTSYLTNSVLLEEHNSYPINRGIYNFKLPNVSPANSFTENADNNLQEKSFLSQYNETHDDPSFTSSIDEKVLKYVNIEPHQDTQNKHFSPILKDTLESSHNSVSTKDKISQFIGESPKRPRYAVNELYDAENNSYNGSLGNPFFSQLEKHITKQQFTDNSFSTQEDYTPSYPRYILQKPQTDQKDLFNKGELNPQKSYVVYRPVEEKMYPEIPRLNDKIGEFSEHIHNNIEATKFTESKTIPDGLSISKISIPSGAQYNYSTELRYSEKPNLQNTYGYKKVEGTLSFGNPDYDLLNNHKDQAYSWQYNVKKKYDETRDKTNYQTYDKNNYDDAIYLQDVKKYFGIKNDETTIPKDLSSAVHKNLKLNWKPQITHEEKTHILYNDGLKKNLNTNVVHSYYDVNKQRSDNNNSSKNKLKLISDVTDSEKSKSENEYQNEDNKIHASWKIIESPEEKILVKSEQEEGDNYEETGKMLLSKSDDTGNKPLPYHTYHRGTAIFAKGRRSNLKNIPTYNIHKIEHGDGITNIYNTKDNKYIIYKNANPKFINDLNKLPELKQTDGIKEINKIPYSASNRAELETDTVKLLLNNDKYGRNQANRKQDAIENHHFDYRNEIVSPWSQKENSGIIGKPKLTPHKNDYDGRDIVIHKLLSSGKEDNILETKVESFNNDQKNSEFENKFVAHNFHPNDFYKLQSNEQIINLSPLKNKLGKIRDGANHDNSRIINPENSREFTEFSSHNKLLNIVTENSNHMPNNDCHLKSIDKTIEEYPSEVSQNKPSSYKYHVSGFSGKSSEIYSPDEKGHIVINKIRPYHSEYNDNIIEFQPTKKEFNGSVENEHVGLRLKTNQPIKNEGVKLLTKHIQYNSVPHNAQSSVKINEMLKHLSSTGENIYYKNDIQETIGDSIHHLTHKDKIYDGRAFIKQNKLLKLLNSQENDKKISEIFYKSHKKNQNVDDVNEHPYKDTDSKDIEALQQSTRNIFRQKQYHKSKGFEDYIEELNANKYMTGRSDVNLVPKRNKATTEYDIFKYQKSSVDKEENLEDSMLKHKVPSMEDHLTFEDGAHINKYDYKISHKTSKPYNKHIYKTIFTSSENKNYKKQEAMLHKLALHKILLDELKMHIDSIQELKVVDELLNSDLFKDAAQIELEEAMKTFVSDDEVKYQDQLDEDVAQLEIENAISNTIEEKGSMTKLNDDPKAASIHEKLVDAITACRELKTMVDKDINKDALRDEILILLKDVGLLKNVREDGADPVDEVENAKETENNKDDGKIHYLSDDKNIKQSKPYIETKTQSKHSGENMLKFQENTEELISEQNDSYEDEYVPNINEKYYYSSVTDETLPVHRNIIKGESYTDQQYDKSTEDEILSQLIHADTPINKGYNENMSGSHDKISTDTICEAYHELLPLHYKLCESFQKQQGKSKGDFEVSSHESIDIPKHEDYIHTPGYFKTKKLQSSSKEESPVHIQEFIRKLQTIDNDNSLNDFDEDGIFEKEYLDLSSRNNKTYTSPDREKLFKKQNHENSYDDILKLLAEAELGINEYLNNKEDGTDIVVKNELSEIQETAVRPRCSELIKLLRINGICFDEENVKGINNSNKYIQYGPKKVKSETDLHNGNNKYSNDDNPIHSELYNNGPIIIDQLDSQTNKHNKIQIHYDDLYEKIKILYRYLDNLNSRKEDSVDKTTFKNVIERLTKPLSENKFHLKEKYITDERDYGDARKIQNENTITVWPEVKDETVFYNLYPTEDSQVIGNKLNSEEVANTIADEDIEKLIKELMVTKDIETQAILDRLENVTSIIEELCHSKIDSSKSNLKETENELIYKKLRMRIMNIILKQLNDNIIDDNYIPRLEVTSEIPNYCPYLCHENSIVQGYKMPPIPVRLHMCHKCQGNFQKNAQVLPKSSRFTVLDNEYSNTYPKHIKHVDTYPNYMKEIDLYQNYVKGKTDLKQSNYFKDIVDLGLQSKNVKEISDEQSKYIPSIIRKHVKETDLHRRYITDSSDTKYPTQIKEIFNMPSKDLKGIAYTYPNNKKVTHGIQLKDNKITAPCPEHIREIGTYPNSIAENIEIAYPNHNREISDSQPKYVKDITKVHPKHYEQVNNINSKYIMAYSKPNNIFYHKKSQLLPDTFLVEKYENIPQPRNHYDSLGQSYHETQPRPDREAMDSETLSDISGDTKELNSSLNENQDILTLGKSYDIEYKNRRKRSPSDSQTKNKKITYDSLETQIKRPSQSS